LFNTTNWSLTQPFNIGISVVKYETTGGTASAFNSNPPNPLAPGQPLMQSIAQGTGGTIVGASASAGFSFGYTNANIASDLFGRVATTSAGAGLGLDVSGQLSEAPNGIFIATVSPPATSVGVGVSASIYPTDTSVQTLYTTEPQPSAAPTPELNPQK
jgi:hypothetical protein